MREMLLLFSCWFAIVTGQWAAQDGKYGPLTIQQKCRTFSTPNRDANEFYSPLYPTNYPNNTDCTLNIEAEFGYIIRVDFRDYFEIEPSENCEHDFLEIRDGPQAYSDLIGRFCGDKFPPIITSRDRYLWLRFRSDETLEYRGFRAVYEFKNQPMGRPEISPCHFEVSGVEGMITNDDIPQSRFNYSEMYRTPIDCTWSIRVEPGQKLYLFFEAFELHQPNECDLNFVDLFDAQRRRRIKHFCGSVADSVQSVTHVMHLRFFALGQGRISKFIAWYTAYREYADDTSGCRDDEYDCDDATCIDASLWCNGVKNCRHEYDEEGCSDSKKAKFDITSHHIIIILIMGVLLLGGMCCAMCVNCVRKLLSDANQIQENIRRSRVQIGDSRNSLGTSSTLGIKCEHALSGMEFVPNGQQLYTMECPMTDDEEAEDDDYGKCAKDDEDDDDEEEIVITRDNVCQTRPPSYRSRSGGLQTPPPPPPPTSRPPTDPPQTPARREQVPTPPPPPTYPYTASMRPQPNERFAYESAERERSRLVGRSAANAHDNPHSRSSSRTTKLSPDVVSRH